MNSTEKKQEIYSVSEFKDLVSSNNFYTVAAIALVLGVASAMGFIQEPRKLKSVVDTLSSKVTASQPASQTMLYKIFKRDRYGLSAKTEWQAIGLPGDSAKVQTDYFDHGLRSTRLFPNNQQVSFPYRQIEWNIQGFIDGVLTKGADTLLQPVNFDYNIASRTFWNDFNHSTRFNQQSDFSGSYLGNTFKSGRNLRNLQGGQSYLIGYNQLNQADQPYSIAGLLRKQPERL